MGPRGILVCVDSKPLLIFANDRAAESLMLPLELEKSVLIVAAGKVAARCRTPRQAAILSG